MKNTIQDTVKEVYNTNNSNNPSFRKKVHNFNTKLSSNNAYKKGTTDSMKRSSNANQDSSDRFSSSGSVAGLSGLAALETIKSTSSSSSQNSASSILWAFIIVILV